MSFDTLGLEAELLRAVHDLGYTQPTPIQARGIPAVLEGRDLLAAPRPAPARPRRSRCRCCRSCMPSSRNPRGSRAPRALVLAPTRELAAQIEQRSRAFGAHLRQQSA